MTVDLKKEIEETKEIAKKSLAIYLWCILIAFTVGALISDAAGIYGWKWWIISLVCTLVPITVFERR